MKQSYSEQRQISIIHKAVFTDISVKVANWMHQTPLIIFTVNKTQRIKQIYLEQTENCSLHYAVFKDVATIEWIIFRYFFLKQGTNTETG